MVLVVAIGLSPERLLALASTIRYQAAFADASGLTAGNKVAISGMNVGTVLTVTLNRDGALVNFAVDAAITLGSETTAHIRTGSLLGERELTLESAGNGVLRPMAAIPATRTFSPYTLTQAVGELTTNTAGTDTGAINQALDVLSETLDQIAPQLGPTFDGLTRLSKTLNDRNESLSELFSSGANMTTVLATRSQQLNSLILDANDLVAVLSDRRRAIMELLANISAVSTELTGLVHDNEQELAPTLDKLNSVAAMLEKNRDNIAIALPRLAKYQVTLGETVSNGPYYTAYVPNFDLPAALQPFLDYSLGFRRGIDAGQPPDNAGPRAELPIPRNGIPQGPH
jgi:phospholipid/cholesterol/gamma-HCH transport system substrate-binding protein